MLPVYEAQIDSVDTGICALSLVNNPATESMLLCFEEDARRMQFSVVNEEKRILTGLIMCADRPIYRRTAGGQEYYILFRREVLEAMAERMLLFGTENVFNFNHNPELPIYGMKCREIYFKDIERGICPKGFEDVEDGSMFGTFHVTDDNVWEEVKTGKFGISLEGVFDYQLVETEEDKLLAEIEEIIKQIAE